MAPAVKHQRLGVGSVATTGWRGGLGLQEAFMPLFARCDPKCDMALDLDALFEDIAVIEEPHLPVGRMSAANSSQGQFPRLLGRSSTMPLSANVPKQIGQHKRRSGLADQGNAEVVVAESRKSALSSQVKMLKDGNMECSSWLAGQKLPSAQGKLAVRKRDVGVQARDVDILASTAAASPSTKSVVQTRPGGGPGDKLPSFVTHFMETMEEESVFVPEPFSCRSSSARGGDGDFLPSKALPNDGRQETTAEGKASHLMTRLMDMMEEESIFALVEALTGRRYGVPSPAGGGLEALGRASNGQSLTSAADETGSCDDFSARSNDFSYFSAPLVDSMVAASGPKRPDIVPRLDLASISGGT
jgi:hypothetical protein